MISTVIPNASGPGLHRRAAAHLRLLARHGDVSLLVLNAASNDIADVPKDIAEVCHSVTVISDEGARSTVSSRLPGAALIAELCFPQRFRGLPPENNLAHAVELMAAVRYDMACCFRIKSALVLMRLEHRFGFRVDRRIVDFDDIESAALTRSMTYLADQNGRELGVINKIRVRRTIAVENGLLKTFDATIVCSTIDRDSLAVRAPLADICVIPNCVRLDNLPARCWASGKMNILFVGTMSYAPNIDAVQWFCLDILPRILDRAATRCEVFIVGFRPSDEIRALADLASVTVTGGVDSVVPYYQDADIVIAPIRFGGGTRIKILEAMGMAKPVVSTTIGAEGIEIDPGRNILIADTEDAFAEACLILIADPTLRHRLGSAARYQIEEKYTEEVIAKEFGRIVALPRT
ncbi:MAG: glycosyltransferase family 4 protein [Alphaproteobacteria bacterium]|jgi:glycosyltransferase involved in cell wall biosynthesis